jgi:hypothetical protein
MSDKTGERDNPFVPALAAGAVLVGFIAFLAWIGLGAFEDDFRTGDDGGAHALSKSAVGYSGLPVMLNAMGRPAQVARGPVTSGGLMILTIDQGDPRTPLLGLPTTQGFDGPVLAVLPKWQTEALLHKGWVRARGLRRVDADTWIGPGDRADEAQDTGAPGNRSAFDPPTDEKSAPAPDKPDNERFKGKLGSVTRPRIALTQAEGKARHTLTVVAKDGFPGPGPLIRVQTGELDRFQTFSSAPGLRPLVVDEKGGIVVAADEEGGFFALSEPDLLNNHGLSDIENARAALFLINLFSADGPVYLDVTLNGFQRTRSLLKLMLQPPFLGATLCALAAALMMIWHALWRFGQAARGARAFAMGKTALADNQAGLIRMAGRQHRMGGGYAALVRDLVARAVAAPRDLAGAGLEALLDRLGKGRTTEALTDITAAADQAANKSQLMDAAQRLHRWRLEMTRESR